MLRASQERAFLAIAMNYPSLIIPDVVLIHQQNHNILTVFQHLRNTKVEETLFVAKSKQLGFIIPVEELRTLRKEMVPKDKSDAAKLLAFLASLFTEENRINAIVRELDEAKVLLFQRKENEAFAKLRGIRVLNEELVSTRQQMILSVQEVSAFETGIQDIDERMGGFLAGNLMAITGDTGTMKTTLSVWAMLEILIKNPNFKGLYFEKEMHVNDLARKLVSKMMRRTTKELITGIINGYADSIATHVGTEYDTSQFKDAFDRLMLVPNNRFNTTADMHKLIVEHNANIWCLDFMTQIVMDSNNINEAVSKAANGLKNIVADTGSFGIVINQSRKMDAIKRDKRVTENDAEWSGTVKQVASYHVGIFYPYKYYGNWNLKGTVLQENWIYLMFLKTRHDSGGFYLPLLTNPAFSEFIPPNEQEKEAMRFWYNEYKG